MSRGLAIALGLSAAAHLVVAGMMLAPATPPPAAGERIVTIQLAQPAILAASEPTPAPEPQATPRREARTPPPGSRPTRAAQPSASSATPAPSAQAIREVVTATVPAELAARQTIDTSAASDALQQQVGQLLSRHFHYPRLARKRGWEGIVELGMHIAADGRVSNIILHRRSAYPTLDQAALLAAGHLRSVPGAATLLDKDGLELVVPVHYRLIDS